MLWTIESTATRTLGLHLNPSRNANKGWIVAASTINQSIRKGMTLLSINDIPSHTLNHAQLVQKMQLRPLCLRFQPAPKTATTRRLRHLSTMVTVQVTTPDALGIELIPLQVKQSQRNTTGGWMIKARSNDRYPRLRRGMTLMQINGHVMRGATDKKDLMARIRQRPLELVFKPAKRSHMSKRMTSAEKSIVVQMPRQKDAVLGIEFTKRKRGGRYMVSRSKNPRVRRGMTLQRINQVDTRTLATVQDVIQAIRKQQSNISKNKVPTTLVFQSAPVSSRSLSPSSTDRHRRQQQRGRGRTKVVRVVLCGDRRNGLGLHLQARHRGGAVVKHITNRLQLEWLERQQKEQEKEEQLRQLRAKERVKEEGQLTEADMQEQTREVRQEADPPPPPPPPSPQEPPSLPPPPQLFPLRRGFTLLSINGKDVSIKAMPEISAMLQFHIGTPFDTEWRAPPRHSRSLSPGIRATRSASPPPNRHVDVLHVRHNKNEQGPLGLEMIPSKKKTQLLVKSVHGWSFKNTEVRRGMVLISVNGKGMTALEDLRSIKNNVTNVYIFRSAPAAVLTEKKRQQRTYHQSRTYFETMFASASTTAPRTSFGIELQLNKNKNKILLKSFNGKCTNASLLRKGAELIQVDGVDVREQEGKEKEGGEEGEGAMPAAATTNNATTIFTTVVELLHSKLQATAPVKMTWVSAPPTSLAAKMLRDEKKKEKQRQRHHNCGYLSHLYHLKNRLQSTQSNINNNIHNRKNPLYTALQLQARTTVGLSIDQSLRTVVPLIEKRMAKLRWHAANAVVDTAITASVTQRHEQVLKAIEIKEQQARAEQKHRENIAKSRMKRSPATKRTVPNRETHRNNRNNRNNRNKKKNQKKNRKRTPTTGTTLTTPIKNKGPASTTTAPSPDKTISPPPFRICVTLNRAEHDPGKGVYWIKSKALLDGSAERLRLQKEAERRKLKLKRRQEQQEKEKAIKLALKLGKQKHTQNKWGMLKTMTSTAVPTKLQKNQWTVKRNRTQLGVNGLPILTTLLHQETLQLERIGSSKDEHYLREQQEADRLMERVLLKHEHEQEQKKEQTKLERRRRNQRQRPQTATPTRKEISHRIENNRGPKEEENDEEEEYYRITKGQPLFTGGQSPFGRRRPSSAPRTPFRDRNNSSILSPSASKETWKETEMKHTDQHTAEDCKKEGALFNMTDSHRTLMVDTAMVTVPPKYRSRYSKSFLRLLWKQAIDLLINAMNRLTIERLKRSIKRWKKDTLRKRKLFHLQTSITLQCWWRVVQATHEMHERKELHRLRAIRQAKLLARDIQKSMVVQAWYRGESCRIELGWKGRAWKRKDAIQQLILLQRRWRGAAAKLLAHSLAVLRARQDNALRLLQRWGRGEMGRARCRLARKLHRIEARAHLVLEKRTQLLATFEENGAASTLKYWWLEMMRRQRMRTRIKLIKGRAAFKLTRWSRGVLGRKRFRRALNGLQGQRLKELKAVSTLLQTRARIFLARLLLKRKKYVHFVYAREKQDRIRHMVQKRSTLIRKIKGIPKKALFYAKQYFTPFQYRTQWQAAVTIQSYWRREYYWRRTQQIKRFIVRRRRAHIRHYTVLVQARVRGHQIRRARRRVLEGNSVLLIQKLWRGYWSRRAPVYHRAVSILQAIWRGKEAWKDYKLQNGIGSDGGGPMMEARQLIMARYHTAFHGPARRWLARRRAKQQRELRRRRKEWSIVGEYEYRNTVARRRLWLMRCSIRTALASGASKVGGLGGGQGSGSGKTIVEVLFRAVSATRKNAAHRKRGGGGGGFVMKSKAWKVLIEPLLRPMYLTNKEQPRKPERSKSKSKSPLKKKKKQPQTAVTASSLVANKHRQYTMKVDILFAQAKSRGDGCTFDDFIALLSLFFDEMNEEAKRIGGWTALPILRTLNQVWGGLLQPWEVTAWQPILDDNTQQYYYYNTDTQESRWVAPAGVLRYHRLLEQQQQQEERQPRQQQQQHHTRSPSRRRKVVHSRETKIDRASTVLAALFVALSKTKSIPSTHKQYCRLVNVCVQQDMLAVVKRIQNKWKGRPNFLSVLLDAAYHAKYQAWLVHERNWAALTIQCAYRRVLGRRIAWALMCKRIMKFQVVETDEVAPLFHASAGPEVVSRISHFWYDKGRIGKAKSKHWTIPPILCHLGDVPVRVVDNDTVNPLCQFCDEDPQWLGHGDGNGDGKSEGDESALPWFDVAERRQKEHQRRTVTRRCNDCSEMYCSSCYNRCHVKGHQAQHQWTPMLKCERCDYLLATVECFGCAAHPLWKEVHDLGHANATGRVYYHNAHIGAGKGGETSWDKPFGYDGSSKMCEGCFHASHPVSKFKLLSADHPEDTAAQFMKKMKMKDHLWKHGEQGGEITRKRPVHRYKALTRRCDECGDQDERPALWSCHDCGYFCTACLNKTHSTGNRQYHSVEQYCELRTGDDALEKDRLEELRRLQAIEEDRVRRIKEVMYQMDLRKAARVVQKCWRRIMLRKRQDNARRNALLQYRKQYAQLRQDDKQRQTPLYRVKRGFGVEPALKSDGDAEKARKRMLPLTQKSLSDKMEASVGFVKRNVLRGEYKLNGLVKMKKGYRIAYTTESMVGVLERGDTIRIGPTAMYTVQLALTEEEIDEKKREKLKVLRQLGDHAQYTSTEERQQKEEEIVQAIKEEYKERPFNKAVVPLDDYWYDEDATLFLYYVQDTREAVSCNGETAKDIIEGRIKRAWLLANPRKPNLEAIAEQERLRKIAEQRAQYMGETDGEKDKRIQSEQAATKARMTTLKNRAKLRNGGRKGRAQRMKNLRRNKAAAAKKESEESARLEAWNNSYDD